MGRPFASEIAELASTYKWSQRADVSSLERAVLAAMHLPLVAVGSGGSLSAAQFCADLHQQFAGQVARIMTPLELVGLGGPPRECATFIFSAGGRNGDVRAAVESSIRAEPRVLALVTARPNNPSSRYANEAGFPIVADFAIPTKRDGFLATNSLVCFFGVIARAYGVTRGGLIGMPPVSSFADPERESIQLDARLWRQIKTLVVLHGPDTRAAAVDLESKCTEAGLVHVQIADFRNFAHGRHHWLAKHSDTAVISLESHRDESLARRTLRLLPKRILSVRIASSESTPIASLDVLGRVFQLVKYLGILHGIDPGRPGVPDFGSKLYSLRAIGDVTPGAGADPTAHSAVAAISRKSRIATSALQAGPTVEAWARAYDDALGMLTSAEYAGVVFDYDGTLVDGSDRFTGPKPEMASALSRLLRAGVPIGIATGRGRSSRSEMRACLPKSLLGRVLMGYYNGGSVGTLDDDEVPVREETVAPPLGLLWDEIRHHSLLTQLAKLTPRPAQITIEPCSGADFAIVWDLLAGFTSRSGALGIRLVRSSHSIDVLGPDVSKESIPVALRARFFADSNKPILCVGDRGQWPGNDADLLSGLHAVSVDQVSPDPYRAWNFSAAGFRGARATLMLCDALELVSSKQGFFRIDRQKLTRPSRRRAKNDQ